MQLITILYTIGILTLGIMTQHWGWRVFWGCCIFLFTGSVWANQYKTIPSEFFTYYPGLARERAETFLVFVGTSLAIYFIGIGVGALASNREARLVAKAIQLVEEGIRKNYSSEQIVDLIDRGLNSVIGVQHAWAQANWHILDFQQKLVWASARRGFLCDLAKADTSLDFIASMQRADMEFGRLGGARLENSELPAFPTHAATHAKEKVTRHQIRPERPLEIKVSPDDRIAR